MVSVRSKADPFLCREWCRGRNKEERDTPRYGWSCYLQAANKPRGTGYTWKEDVRRAYRRFEDAPQP